MSDHTEHIKSLTAELNDSLSLSLPSQISYESLVQLLALHINQMIDKDFPGLVQLLYRMDVSEKKLQSLLANDENRNSGELIAELMIERAIQKIETRKKFSSNADDIPEEEKW